MYYVCSVVHTHTHSAHSHTASICQKTRFVDENEIASFQRAHRCCLRVSTKRREWASERAEVCVSECIKRMSAQCMHALWYAYQHNDIEDSVRFIVSMDGDVFAALLQIVWNIMVNRHRHSFGFSNSVAAFVLRTPTFYSARSLSFLIAACVCVWCHYHHFAYTTCMLNTTLCMMHFCWCNFAMVARCAHKPENPNKGKQAKQRSQPTKPARTTKSNGNGDGT